MRLHFHAFTLRICYPNNRKWQIDGDAKDLSKSPDFSSTREAENELCARYHVFAFLRREIIFWLHTVESHTCDGLFVPCELSRHVYALPTGITASLHNKPKSPPLIGDMRISK